MIEGDSFKRSRKLSDYLAEVGLCQIYTLACN